MCGDNVTFRATALMCLFDDPNGTACVLYAEYWKRKLKDVSFPDSLVMVIAEETKRFSFAYLKEAFVSALVTLLTEKEDGHIVTFERVIKRQIKALRMQLDEGSIKRGNADGKPSVEVPVFPRPRVPTEKTDIALTLEHLSMRLLLASVFSLSSDQRLTTSLESNVRRRLDLWNL
ncbi:hypothetical protein BJY52DRAFT_1228859 [Lactarius psammicola]|nr:hypothetical protein BJY52DRAFT_1228859 [Lactarius psammicola]